MIKINLTVRKFDADSELKRYIERKLSKLDRYFPHSHRPTGMRVELHRNEAADPAKRYSGLAHISVAKQEIVAETASMNPHTVVDILEAKLKEQIRKYKAKHAPKRLNVRKFFQAEVTE